MPEDGEVSYSRRRALYHTLRRFQAIRRAIALPDPSWSLELVPEPGQLFLRVRCTDGTDNVTGEPGFSWYGRKWRLSPHMTDGEFVQTAFLAVMTAMEHEVRERFKFMGQAIFDPHYDIYKLVELRAAPEAIKERNQT